MSSRKYPGMQHPAIASVQHLLALPFFHHLWGWGKEAHCGAQRLFLVLWSEIIPGATQGPYRASEIEPVSATCKRGAYLANCTISPAIHCLYYLPAPACLHPLFNVLFSLFSCLQIPLLYPEQTCHHPHHSLKNLP